MTSGYTTAPECARVVRDATVVCCAGVSARALCLPNCPLTSTDFLTVRAVSWSSPDYMCVFVCVCMLFLISFLCNSRGVVISHLI